jgi:hypothetical protein
MQIHKSWSGLNKVNPKRKTGMRVEGITMDGFFLRENNGVIPRVDFYRLDIQGCECRALASSQATIDNSPNIVITMEWEARLLKDYSNPEE